jgi:hypothetical protein
MVGQRANVWLPKLDVAGSSPVARSLVKPLQYNLKRNRGGTDVPRRFSFLVDKITRRPRHAIEAVLR